MVWRRPQTRMLIAAGVAAGLLTLGLGAYSANAVDGAPGYTSVVRFHAGTTTVSDSRKLQWSPDTQYATGGKVVTTTANITGTDDPQLYTAQRVGDFSYDIPAKDGTYRLQLSFAEIDPSKTRTFTVSSGDDVLLNHFAITDHVARYQALVVWLTIDVTGGSLPLQFSSDDGAPAVAGAELLRKTTVSANTPVTAKPAGADVPVNAAAAMTPDMTGWKLVASDEFTGTSVDKKMWGLYSGAGNGGVGFRDPSHVVVKNGEMQIVGVGDTSGGAAFNHDQTYGRFVIRARQDAGHGYGPALMLWPSTGSWPEAGEIDISEMPEGDAKLSHFTLHWGADNSQDAVTAKSDFSQWHTWTVEWMPDHITFWLDGVKQHTFTDPDSIPHAPFHIAVQNDVGDENSWIAAPNAATPKQVATHIDFVRVYAASN